MPGTYKFDFEQNLITLKYQGEMSVDDIIEFNKSIIADPDFKTHMNTISDLTEADFRWSLGEVDRYRQFVQSIADLTRGTKWAVISSGGMTENTVKMFSTLQKIYDKIVQFKVFNDRSEAMKWLKR